MIEPRRPGWLFGTVSGLVLLSLFAIHYVVSGVLPTGRFPSPFESEADLRAFFAENQSEIRALSAVDILTAVVLLTFSGAVVGWLQVVAAERRDATRFIYDHPDLRTAIELKATEAIGRFSGQLASTALVTGASLRADLENTKAQNQRLREQVRVLERRLSEALGQEVTAELAGRGIVLGATGLQDQVACLQVKIDELDAELRRRDDDLEGARQANRDLMAELKRPRTRPDATTRSVSWPGG